MTIFKGPQEMEVEVILASRADGCQPLYTVRCRYPRIIHGEIMTHRDFSRNARSSRAVPIKTMLNEVRNSPFVPWHWGKNQKGMQGAGDHNQPVIIPYGFVNDWDFDTPISREDAWLYARDRAVEVAEAFMTADYHKQIPNRLLEPFSWIDTLISSSRWDNFLWLREHGDAEPHFQDLAKLVGLAIKDAELQELEPNQWHLPYITTEDRKFVEGNGMTAAFNVSFLAKISAARCARISYKPFDGDASYEREIERYDSLLSSDRVHASPLEHQATPDHMITIEGMMLDKEGNDIEHLGVRDFWNSPRLHGNLPGWIQYRKTVPGEVYRDPV